jgi:putative flippase GtrA
VFVNLGVFNALRLGPLGPDARFLGESDRVVTAKILATLVSIGFAWLAHRHWTFRGTRRHRPMRELAMFVVVNAAALAAEAGTVAISHYVLSFTSLLDDNLASIVGIGLGTIARYAGYKVFVFAPGAISADADAG